LVGPWWVFYPSVLVCLKAWPLQINAH